MRQKCGVNRISCVFAEEQGFVLDSSSYDIEDGKE